MARTTATNFTAALQFPYATAATDLFKKEDVQVLAQAVDQHDHSSGKALAVARLAAGVVDATAIADGSITSAKILDGTIQGGDIADGAITSAKILDLTIQAGDMADGAVSTVKIAAGAVSNTNNVSFTGATTTSTTYVSLTPNVTVDLGTSGGEILVTLFGTARYTGSAGRAQFGIQLDAGTAVDCARNDAGVVNVYQVSGGTARFTGVSSGTHTITPKFRSPDGVSVQADVGTMNILGLKR
jgi:hypothetical protein